MLARFLSPRFIIQDLFFPYVCVRLLDICCSTESPELDEDLAEVRWTEKPVCFYPPTLVHGVRNVKK